MLQAIAGMLGWKPPAPEEAPSIAELGATAPPGLAVVRGAHIDIPAALDEDVLRIRNRARAAAIAHRNRSEGAE
jgi:hypothetical protein